MLKNIVILAALLLAAAVLDAKAELNLDVSNTQNAAVIEDTAQKLIKVKNTSDKAQNAAAIDGRLRRVLASFDLQREIKNIRTDKKVIPFPKKPSAANRMQIRKAAYSNYDASKEKEESRKILLQIDDSLKLMPQKYNLAETEADKKIFLARLELALAYIGGAQYKDAQKMCNLILK